MDGGGAGTQSASTPAEPQQQPGVKATYSASALKDALLRPSDLPAGAPAKEQRPVTANLGNFSSQQSPGITFDPKECVGAGIQSGLESPDDLRGPSRVFPNRPFEAGSRSTPSANGMISSSVIPTVVDLAKIQNQVNNCNGATVKLTRSGVTGKLTMRVVSSAPDALTVDQTVAWNGNVPAAEQAAASLLNAETTYKIHGSVTIWVATMGNAGVKSTALAPAADRRATTALR